MKKILSIDHVAQIAADTHKEGKHIVLVGGCFDLLHVGHMRFLQEAKNRGDILMVLLESDETIKRRKDHTRPINSQALRAEILSYLIPVDYIVLLPDLKENTEYDKLILQIKPAIIATTKGDPGRVHKERQAKLIQGQVVDVIERLAEHSSTNILKKHSE